MNWIEIHITCSANQAELLSEQLTIYGALAVTFRDAADQPIYEPHPDQSTALWPETIATGLFPETQPLDEVIDYLEQLQAQGTIKTFQLAGLPEQDWVRVNLDSFTPILIGKRLCICPSWMPPPDPDRINIMLDPGLAFGTGSHPTTALCLEWLEENLSPESVVIDYGCGSGILSLAALKLGAKKVIAIDYDQQALTATLANAALNHIDSSRLETYLPQAVKPVKVGLIIANILAQPLMELAPTFFNLLNNNGKIVLSGILAEQQNTLVDFYSSWFKIAKSKQKDGWVCLEGRTSKMA